MTLGEAREMDIPEVVDEIEKLLYGQPFQIPAQFAFTGTGHQHAGRCLNRTCARF